MQEERFLVGSMTDDEYNISAFSQMMLVKKSALDCPPASEW
jgi:hypothetical protein